MFFIIFHQSTHKCRNAKTGMENWSYEYSSTINSSYTCIVNGTTDYINISDFGKVNFKCTQKRNISTPAGIFECYEVIRPADEDAAI